MRKIKTKPFDLEKALKGAPVVTRDGHRVEIIGYDPLRMKYPVLFKVENDPLMFSATDKGISWASSHSLFDLFLLDEETQEGGEQ